MSCGAAPVGDGLPLGLVEAAEQGLEVAGELGHGSRLTLATGPAGTAVILWPMDELRRACATVAAQARSVTVVTQAIPAYAAALPPRRGARA